MKKKFHNFFHICSFILSKEKFKIVYILSILLCIYGVIYNGFSSDIGAVTAILMSFGFHVFQFLFLVLCFINTLNVCEVFSNDFDVILIRLKDKRNVVLNFLKYNTIITSIYFFLFLFVTFILQLIVRNFSLGEVYVYGITYNYFYAIYGLIRMFLLILCFSNIFTMLYYKFREKSLLFILILLIGLIPMSGYGSARFNQCLNPFIYFSFMRFSSFKVDFLASITCILFFSLIEYFMFYLFTKKDEALILNKVFKNNYTIKNDLFYIFTSISKTIVVCVCTFLFMAIFFKLNNADYNFIIDSSLGYDSNILESGLIKIIMFLLNITLYTFIFFKLFMKDFLYQLQDIFFRMSITKWFLCKILFIFIIFFILKLVQFLMLLVVVGIGREEIMFLLSRFYLDYSLVIFIPLCIYTLFILYKIIDNKIIKYVCLFLFSMFTLLCYLKFNKFIIFISIIVVVLLLFINKYYFRKVCEIYED